MTRSKLLCIVMFLSHTALAQYSDFGTWLSASAEKEIINDLTAQVEFQTRWDVQFVDLETAFTDLSLDYKINKHFRAGFNYRLGLRYQDEGYFLPRNRAAIDGEARTEWKKIKFNYRLRYQIASRGVVNSEENVEFINAFRHKIKASKKIAKRTQGSLATEFYYRQLDTGSYAFSDLRLVAAVERRIAKRQFVQVGLLYQQEVNRTYPNHEYVLTLGYEYEFK